LYPVCVRVRGDGHCHPAVFRHGGVSRGHCTGPIGAIYTEYDAQGDLELGKKLARKLRASNVSLVVAVGLKAALAAKVEIVDVPIVYMMILDPLKHQLTAANMTGTLLEVPIDRQLKIMRTFLPTLHQLGTLYDPGASRRE
jgi:putative ABC transport system substrate-binding protein